jgi:peptide/nickel transport system substrate-binding protein
MEWRRLTALLLVALAIGGCDSGDDDDTGATTGSNSDAATTAAADLQPVDQVTIGVPQPIVTLDTNRALDPLTYILMHLVSASLTTVDENAEPAPGLAESWEVSEDGLTYTFKLKEGLKFSDGTPLTAEDVAATFTRFLTDEANISIALGDEIDTVTAPDPTTAVFKLKVPYTSLPIVLSTPTFGIYPKSAYEGTEKDTETFFQNPISAGPYALEGLGGGDNPVLVRNDNYFGPKPLVERLNFKLIEDPNTRVAQLSSGEIDVAFDIPPSLLGELPDSAEADVVPHYGVAGLFTSNTDPLLSDVNIRQAIHHAIDREQINEVVWSGEISTLAGLWPSEMTGNDPDISADRDVGQAKELLTGTECENGCSIEILTTPFFSWAQATALIIQQNLADIGIDAKLKPVEASIWFDALANGTYQSTIGNLYDFVDAPDAMLVFGLQSKPYNAQGTNYKSPEMDELIEKATQTDGADRTAAIAEIQELFQKDRPWVTLTDYAVISVSTLPAGLVTYGHSSFYDVASESPPE